MTAVAPSLSSCQEYVWIALEFVDRDRIVGHQDVIPCVKEHGRNFLQIVQLTFDPCRLVVCHAVFEAKHRRDDIGVDICQSKRFIVETMTVDFHLVFSCFLGKSGKLISDLEIEEETEAKVI